MNSFRRRFLILLFTFSGIAAQAQFNFEDISVQDAVNKSASTNKPVFLMLYQSTCGHCEKMLNEVMTDTAVFEFYNRSYINVKVEMLKHPDAQKLIKQFNVQSFPTFVIMNKDVEVLSQFVGEFKAEDFLNMGELALQQDHQLPYLKNEFLKNTGDSIACYNYLLALGRGRLATQHVANLYYSTIKDHFEFTAYNWKIFSMSVSDMESEIFQLMRTNRIEFGQVVTQKKVDKKLYLTAAYNLQVTSAANDTLNYQKVKTLSLQLGLHPVDSMVFVTSLNLYEKNKSWNNYISTAIGGAEIFVWSEATQLRRMSETIAQHTSDQSQLQKAANFAVRSAELKPDYFSNLSAAKIYLKLGYHEFAKKYAEKAKELGLKNNINVSEANLVIQQAGD